MLNVCLYNIRQILKFDLLNDQEVEELETLQKLKLISMTHKYLSQPYLCKIFVRQPKEL